MMRNGAIDGRSSSVNGDESKRFWSMEELVQSCYTVKQTEHRDEKLGFGGLMEKV